MMMEKNGKQDIYELWKSLFSKILTCPSCKNAGLEFIGEGIVCKVCGASYEYRHDIPYLYSIEFSNQIKQLRDRGDGKLTISDAVLKANIEFHDENADKYDGDVAIEHLLSDSGKMLVQECVKYCKDHTEGKVWIDAGCGTGQILSIAEHLKFPVTFGLDLSESMGLIARKKGHAVMLGEVFNIPVLDNSVDLVSASALLHHLTDPEQFLKEAFRVLKPGGMLYTDFDPNNRPNYDNKFVVMIRKAWRTFGPKMKSVHTKDDATEHKSRLADYQMYYNNCFNGDYINELLANIGFGGIRIEYYFNKAGLAKKDRPAPFQLLRGIVMAGVTRMFIKKEIAPFFLVLATKPKVLANDNERGKK